MQERQDIVYYDRYAGKTKPEGIFGEKPLRWAYETLAGRVCLEAFIKRKWFSALYGWWADLPSSAKEIPRFLERFDVDPDEFLSSPKEFRTFNEFFYRKLKPEARPIDDAENSVCFPADGRHLLIPDLSRESHIYAKGRKMDLAELVGDDELAERFSDGMAVLSRLCPTDYHRFHFPAGGRFGEPELIQGSLYSVNPIALKRRISYLLENKRRVSLISDSPVGDYLFLEIGATNVGSIVDTAQSGEIVSKGEEKGYFRFGGSMVITVFQKGRICPAEDLSAKSLEEVEIYARMGDKMGTIST